MSYHLVGDVSPLGGLCIPGLSSLTHQSFSLVDIGSLALPVRPILPFRTGRTDRTLGPGCPSPASSSVLGHRHGDSLAEVIIVRKGRAED